LILLVRDADGNILNPNAPATTVSAGGTGGGTVALPAVQVEIPDDTPYVTAEVTLAPAGDGEPVRSSPVTFAVNRPRSGITWITPIGPYPVPTVGTRLRVTLKIDYALATSSPTRNGLLEITITERIAGTKTVLQMFPVVSIDAPPGESKSVTHTFEVDVPLRDVLTEPQNRVLYGELVLKDDAGVVKDKQGTGLPIQNPNLADLVSATPSRIETGGDAPVVTPLGRAHLFVGETPALRFGVRIRRATEGGGTWQLLIGPARFLDGTGRLLLNLPESQPAASDVPVLPNPVSLTQARTFEGRLPGGIPAGTRRLRMYLRLVNGSGVVAAADSIDVEVRDAPTVTAQRDVATGASNLAFTPVRATVNVTANTRAGRLTAEEIAGTFTATGRAHGPVYEEAGQTLSQGSVLADVAYRLIPINRYWALYGTLQESGLNATVTFTYDRTTDFPSDAAFREDSLVIAGLNPLSRALDPLPTTLNKTAQTVRAAYTTFYDTYVVASRKTVNSPTASEEDALPEGFGLDGVFPNPSRGPATVRFRLPESSSVRVEVFDVLGRRVSVLVEGSRAAGVHEAVWDGSSVGPGVYVVRLTAGGALATALLVRR
ncbi:MAG TPA: T9SS type A sorting domain-containing protein, partial [Rhodothermales bacterium]|nr:T9SS type A sorting domain-containing protein [Rhodothermales bacterium]